MTPADIAEMFISAAETEAKLPEVKGMRIDYGRYNLPWFHDLGDINQRRRTNIPAKDIRDEDGEKLLDGEDPMAEWAKGVSKTLAEWERETSKKEIAAWEACLRITAEFIANPNDRRALWAWAMAQAGVLTKPASRSKISFARWCRDIEIIGENTGHKRKNRALGHIAAGYCGKPHLHSEFSEMEGVTNDPELEHKFDTVAGGYAVYDTQRIHASSWQDDPAFRSTGMSLKEWRAAKRRQRQKAA